MTSKTSRNTLEKPAFEYQSLLEPDGIRLAFLHPAADATSELECSLEHATLSQYHHDPINHYTALSYVWRDSTKKHEIVVDGCSLYITTNLHSALCHMRDAKERDKDLGGCNMYQSDTTERNQQVQQMGTVYSVARHTIIYLGESSEEADTLLAEIGSLCSRNRISISEEDLYSKFDDKAIEDLESAIQTHIVGKAWFTRE